MPPMSSNKQSLATEISSVVLQDWIAHSNPSIRSQLDLIISSLRRRQITGALSCAKATLEILRTVLGQCKFTDTDHMMRVVRAIGRILTTAVPVELTIGNIIRRVLYIIREEYLNKKKLNAENSTSNTLNSNSIITTSSSILALKKQTSFDSSIVSTANISLSSTVSASGTVSTSGNKKSASIGSVFVSAKDDIRDSDIDYSTSVGDYKTALMAAISELNDELDNVNQPICEVAHEYIHADECVLVYGYSVTVELFLKSAARKRKFQLIIAESGPGLDGHRLLQALHKHPNITLALIPDTAIYALMSRVNKVLISPNSILADGGAICTSGHMMVAIAAKDFAVPVVGVTGAYKLTPLYSHNQSDVLSHLQSPADVIPYDYPIDLEQVSVVVPAFDYVPPDLIDLYVTNSGCHQPAYMYRLLGEFYHTGDYNLDNYD